MKKYYIGDLCRLFADNEWKIFLDQTDFLDQISVSSGGSGEYKGYTFHFGSTAFGDGSFKDNLGREYGVDSGTIGIVSADFPATSDAWKTGGQIVELEDDFTIYIGGGIFQFGDVEINTQEWDSDDDEDDGEEYFYGEVENEEEEISRLEKNIKLELNKDEANSLKMFLGCLKTSDVERIMEKHIENDYSVETIDAALGVIYIRLRQSIDPLV